MIDKNKLKKEGESGKAERSDDTEDEYDYLEESPCKRYHKINKEVSNKYILETKLTVCEKIHG